MSDFLKPLWDRVVIRPMGIEKTTLGGLHIPESAHKKPCRGEVVAIGPGVYSSRGILLEAGVEIGDTVLYSKHPISAVEYEGLLIMRPIDILGILTNRGG